MPISIILLYKSQSIYFEIEIMDIFEKPFLEFLSYYAMCEERLIPYKMSSKQLENAFKNLDKSRKGYLDVADLYAMDPEMTEQQVLFVFQWFNCSRAGYLTFDDFSKALLTHKEDYHDLVEGQRHFKNYLRIVKATHHSIEGKKKDLAIDQPYLKSLGDRIQLTSGRPFLELQSIIDHLCKYCPEQQESISFILKKNLHKHHLTVDEFADAFRIQQWKPEQRQRYKQPYEKYEKSKLKNYTSDIDEIIQKYETRQPSTPKYQPGYLSYKNNFINDIVDKNHREYIDTGEKMRTNYYNPRSEKIYEEAEKILDSDIIRNRSNDLVKRKEELRKGSLERKKIMEDVMGRKCHPKFLPNQDYQVNVDRKYEKYYPDNDLKNFPKKVLNSRFNDQDYMSEMSKSPHQLTEKRHYTNLVGKYGWDKGMREDIGRRAPSAGKLEDRYNHANLYCTKNSANLPKRLNSYEFVSFQKENIIRRAEEEALKKIDEIERKARMKVIEKKSVPHVPSWHK